MSLESKRAFVFSNRSRVLGKSNIPRTAACSMTDGAHHSEPTLPGRVAARSIIHQDRCGLDLTRAGEFGRESLGRPRGRQPNS